MIIANFAEDDGFGVAAFALSLGRSFKLDSRGPRLAGRARVKAKIGAGLLPARAATRNAEPVRKGVQALRRNLFHMTVLVNHGSSTLFCYHNCAPWTPLLIREDRHDQPPALCARRGALRMQAGHCPHVPIEGWFSSGRIRGLAGWHQGCRVSGICALRQHPVERPIRVDPECTQWTPRSPQCHRAALLIRNH
jgi:hypothetical protein